MAAGSVLGELGSLLSELGYFFGEAVSVLGEAVSVLGDAGSGFGDAAPLPGDDGSAFTVDGDGLRTAMHGSGSARNSPIPASLRPALRPSDCAASCIAAKSYGGGICCRTSGAANGMR